MRVAGVMAKNPIRSLVTMTGPALALQELLYGFIMELIFVTAARVGILDYGSATGLVIMILGMNATWGAIDAVIFYMIGAFSERNHARIIDEARGGRNREEAVEYLMNAFGGTPLDALRPEDERMICERILNCRTEDAAGFSRDRRTMALSSLGCFVITLLTIIPVAAPILMIRDTALALGVASALSSVILFFVGYRMKDHFATNGLAMGLFLTGISWAITIVSTFTGG